MGRRPIGDQPMTATERQRRWRQGLRQRAARPTGDRPAPDPDAQSVIQDLTRERDAARRDCELAREQCDEALRGIMPRPEVVDGHVQVCWCSFCARRCHPQTEVVLVGSVQHRTFLCTTCVETDGPAIIAAARARRRDAST